MSPPPPEKDCNSELDANRIQVFVPVSKLMSGKVFDFRIRTGSDQNLPQCRNVVKLAVVKGSSSLIVDAVQVRTKPVRM